MVHFVLSLRAVRWWGLVGVLLVGIGEPLVLHAQAEDTPNPTWKAGPFIDSEDQSMGPRYSLGLGIVAANFPEIANYSDFYGKPAYYPDLRVTIDLYRLPWISLQGGLGMSYFTDRGHEVRYPEDPSAPLEPTNNRLILTLIPYRFTLGALVTPFDTPYLAFGGWVGYEEAFFREIRRVDDTPSAIPTPGGTTVGSDQDAGEFVNSGWNSSMVYGGALHINIGWIEEKNVRSMAGTMDFSQIYLSPFF